MNRIARERLYISTLLCGFGVIVDYLGIYSFIPPSYNKLCVTTSVGLFMLSMMFPPDEAQAEAMQDFRQVLS